jgi:murein DD-endopeptidase MepM/ murein hydrolase activator NlpD
MAVAPLSLTAEPLESGTLRWLRLAPPAPGQPEKGKLVVRLTIMNTSAAPVTVTGISVSFPGSSAPTASMFRPDIVLKDAGVLQAGETKFWSNGVVNVTDADGTVTQSAYNAVYLALPAPAKVRLSVAAAGFASAATLDLNLAEYQSPAPKAGYPLFLRVSDLPSAAVMTITGRHWSNGGGQGTQIYAYDVGVVRFVDGAWTRTRPGQGTGPGAYYAYGLKVRSVAAGTVDALVDGIDEGPDYGDGNEGGNRITIAHDNGERSYYAHIQKGSFLVAKDDHVQEGTPIGLLGFTGNTDFPHTHIEMRKHSTGALRPYAFRDAWLRGSDADTPFGPTVGWQQLATGRGIPDGSYHVWPSSSRPAWYPPGWAEIMRFGVPVARYQDKFDRATGAGYRPELVDVVEVTGQLFFSVVFRPGDVPWRAQHHLDGNEYQQAYDTNKADGYRLHNITSYARGGTVNYAAIWLKQVGPGLRAYHGRSAAQHDELVDTYTKDGYHPVNVSVAAPTGTRSYAALWVNSAVGGWRSRSTLTPAAYQQLWNEQAGQLGRHGTYVSGWQDGPLGAGQLSVVFSATAPGSGPTVGRHGMSSAQLQEEYDARVSAGWLTRAIAGYTDGGLRYAALWRRP